jgi:hypothetical protein
VYRGSGDIDANSILNPIENHGYWFASEMVAAKYKRRAPGLICNQRLHAYQLMKPINLLAMDVAANVTLLSQRLKGSALQALQKTFVNIDPGTLPNAEVPNTHQRYNKHQWMLSDGHLLPRPRRLNIQDTDRGPIDRKWVDGLCRLLEVENTLQPPFTRIDGYASAMLWPLETEGAPLHAELFLCNPHVVLRPLVDENESVSDCDTESISDTETELASDSE